MSQNAQSGSQATPDQWDREKTRRVLLQSLGIEPLISVRDPVGARASDRLSQPSDFESSAQATRDSEDTISGEQLRALLQDSVISRPVSDTASKADRAAPDSAIPETAPAPQGLTQLFVATEDLLWVETLSDGLLRQEQLLLIAAMARAVRRADINCLHQQFHWPPKEAAALGHVRTNRQEMLAGFTQRLISQHGTRTLIKLGAVEGVPSQGLSVVDMPSSLDLLRDGTLKRDAWRRLKPLTAGD